SHRPQFAAIAARMDAAREGKLARVVDVARVVDPVEIVGRIEPVDRASRNGRERLRALGRFLQRRFERFALPPLLVGFGSRFHTTAIIADRSWVPAPRPDTCAALLDLPAHRTL